MNSEALARSIVEFNKMATAVAEKLRSIGWIDTYSIQREDASYSWTETGRSQFRTFVSNLRKTGLFGNAEVEFLRTHLFYFGIKSKSQTETLFDKVKELFDQNDSEPIWVKIGSLCNEYDRAEMIDLVMALKSANADVLAFRSQEALVCNDWIWKLPKR
jgi:hypothetical protein